jgi:hypothetical protein
MKYSTAMLQILECCRIQNGRHKALTSEKRLSRLCRARHSRVDAEQSPEIDIFLVSTKYSKYDINKTLK